MPNHEELYSYLENKYGKKTDALAAPTDENKVVDTDDALLERMRLSSSLRDMSMGTQMRNIHDTVENAITSNPTHLYNYLTTDDDNTEKPSQVRGKALAEKIQPAYDSVKGEDKDFVASKYATADKLIDDLYATAEDGTIEIDGYKYPKATVSNVMRGIVENTMHPQLFATNKDYRANYFLSNFGKDEQSYYTDRLGTLDKELNELLQMMRNEASSEAQSMTSAANQFGYSNIATPAVQFGLQESMGANVVRDAIDKINSLKKGTLWAGVNEGFDWVSALSMGLNDIASSASLSKILNKITEDEPLSPREELAFKAYTLSKEVDSIGAIVGRNKWNDIGHSLGKISEFALPMAAPVKLATTGVKMTSLGVKEALATTIAVGKKSIPTAIGRGILETAKVGGRLGANFLRAEIAGAMLAPFTPITWANFAEKRLQQYSVNNDGEIEFKPSKLWKDIVDVEIEQANEIASEIFGLPLQKVIGNSAKTFGRLLRLDVVADKVGLGADKRFIFGLRKPAAVREFERSLGFAGLFGDGSSEILGEYLSESMKSVITGNGDVSRLNNSEFWGNTLLISALYGGSLSIATLPLSIEEYKRSNIYQASKSRGVALSRIEDRELRNKMLTISSIDDIDVAAKELAQLDWSAMPRKDIAAAMDFVRADYMEKVLLGDAKENMRMNAYTGVALNTAQYVYRGEDGSTPTDDIISIDTEDGRYMVISGVLDNASDSELICRDANGKIVPIHASKIQGIYKHSLQEELGEQYKQQFGVQIEMDRQQEVIEKLNAIDNPTKNDIISVMSSFGVAEHQSGDNVTLVDGRSGVVDSLEDDGNYIVRVVDNQGEQYLSVPFYDILADDATMAEAQQMNYMQRSVSNLDEYSQKVKETAPEERNGIAIGDIVGAADGRRGRVLSFNEDGTITIDENMSNTSGNLDDAYIVNVAESDITKEDITTQTEPNATEIPTDDAKEVTDEVTDEVTEEVAPESAIAEIKPIPTKEDGLVDYDAIDDPAMFAEQFSKDMGGPEEASVQVSKMFWATQKEIEKLMAKRETLSDANEVVSNRKAVNALNNKLQLYREVIKELNPRPKAGIIENEYSLQLDPKFKKFINTMAETFGLSVEFVEGIKGNAQIDGNKVKIAWEHRDKGIKFLIGHEFTHRMQDLSPEQYAKFKASVKEFMGEDAWNERMARMKQTYIYNNVRFDVTLLEDEVVADFVGALVEQADAFDRYINSVEDKGILAIIAKVLRSIRDFIFNAEAEAAKPLTEMLDKLDTLIESSEVAQSETQEMEHLGEKNTAQGKEKHSLIGEQGAANLDKAEEATTRLDNLAVARDMEAEGKDAKAIRMATGWERGADGLWRYEIMDAKVNLYDGDENTIRKKIEVAEEEEKYFMQQSKADTKELRERTNAYLAEMREKYGVAEGEESDAMTEEEIAQLQSLTSKEIEFEDYKERRRNELYNRRMALEAQLAYVSVKNSEAPAEIATTRLGHILQGNDAEVLFTTYPSLRDIEVQFVTDIRDGAFAAYATKGGYKRIELNAKKTPVNMIAPYILHEVQHAIQDIEGFAGGGNLSSLQSDENVTAKEAYDYYRKIAGEVEARNVSARINMTPEERRATLLSETEDVAREDQIFLREGAEMAMAESKKKSANETVSPNNSDHPAAISSADGAKILKNIDNLARKYQEKSNRPDTFIGDVADALGIDMPNKSSKYRTYETISGDIVTIRLSNNGATASKLDANNETNAVSIVIANSYDGITNDGEAHIVEYFYDAIKLRKADGKPLVGIINSLKQTLYSGKYVDNTGIAEIKEVNAKYSLITPEFDASYLDAVERGDMATAQRMVMEAAKLAMPNTKVVDENGNPKVVYHGTPNNFNAFSKEMFGTSTDRGIWGNGFYFSDSEQYAKTYEKRGDKQGRTLSVFLNNKNPLFISLRNGGNEGAMYFHELMEKHFTDDIYEDITKTEEKTKDANEALSQQIKADGYDGIVVEYTNSIDTEYIAFEPNQIKSADPVTYDDAGNVVPLSERFNPRKEDIRYSLPSLVGVHNISLDKLRKVIKMGGLANPSVAVIDVDKQTHDDYGEYSLVLPKNMVDARQGKNAGTWAGDAWTPTYPQVVKRMNDDKAISRFYKDIDVLPEAMRSRVRLDFNSFMEGRSASALAYWYLFEKGNVPEMVIVPSRYSDDVTNAVSEATNGSFSMYGLIPEERAKCLDAYIAVEFDGDRAAFETEMQERIERLTETIETKKSDRVKKWAQDTIDSINEYGFDYDAVANFIRDVEYDAREKGSVNVDATITAAREQVEANNLEADYDAWRNNLDERYGIEEYIFDGYTNSGDRRYLPHTVENASKWMKKQGRQGAVATFPSFGTFVAVSISKMTTLESIRKRKALLGKSKEEYDAFREKWENVYYELGKKLMPDAKGFDDYGYWRLIEAVGHKNPKEFVKKEYNIELSEEDMTQLNDMLNAIRTEYPARYFETKFERPLQLSDFVAAVVPNDMPMDVYGRLKEANVEIFEYEKGNNNSRAEAMQKASEVENVRFSLQDVEAQRFNRKVEFIKDMAREYNISQPIIVAETAEEYLSTFEDIGVKDPEKYRETAGAYIVSLDCILLNGERINTAHDSIKILHHEYTHSVTHKLWDEVQSIVIALNESDIIDAGKDILPKYYKNHTPIQVLNEIISTFVENIPRRVMLGIFNGTESVENVIKAFDRDIYSGISTYEVVKAILPIVAHNIEIQKQRYGERKENPLVFGRESIRENNGIEGREGNKRSGGRSDISRGYRPIEAESRVYETGRGGEGSQEEVNSRYALLSAPITEEEQIRIYLRQKHLKNKEDIRKKYRAYRSAARMHYEEERAKRSAALKDMRSYAAKVEYILGDQVEQTIPLEHQALAKIARGEIKMPWKALSKELGLKKGEKRYYSGIIKDADPNVTFNSVVHQWWTELGGYTKDIDDQDLRNALIDALSTATSSSRALSVLREIYDKDIQIKDDALDAADLMENEELAAEDARYAEEEERFNANKDTAVEEFVRTSSFYNQIEVVDATVMQIRERLEKTQMALTHRQQMRYYQGVMETIAELKQAVKDVVLSKTIEVLDRNALRSVIDKIDKARSVSEIDGVLAEIEEISLNAGIKTKIKDMGRMLQLRLPNGVSVEEWVDTQVKEGRLSRADGDAILRDKWKGRNAKGVSVAKKVDVTTAAIFQKLSELIYPILAIKGKQRVSADAVSNNNAIIDQLRDDKIAAEHGVAGVTFTEEKEIELQARILYDKFLQTEMLKSDADECMDTRSEIEQHYYGVAGKEAVREKHLTANRKALNEINRQRKEAIDEFNETLLSLMGSGRDALTMYRREQEAHKSMVVNMALDALGVGNRLVSNPPTAMEKVGAFARSVPNAPYYTFQTTLREIDRLAPNGEGRFYNYLMSAWTESNNNFITQHNSHIEEVADALSRILGVKGANNADIIMNMIELSDDKPLLTVHYGGEEAISKANPESKVLTLSNALYVIAMWRQARYRASMEYHGFTQQMYNAVYDAVVSENEKYITFIDWVNNELLPDTRLIYDKVHREMFGASMANERNYFPARLVDPQKAEDISLNDVGALPSTMTGAIVNRINNKNMVNLNMNYFKVLMSHLQEMDQWSTFAPLIRDLNAIVSDKTFKKSCNTLKPGIKADRSGAGSLFTTFKTVSAIAVNCYRPSHQNDVEDFLIGMTRGWAGSNIAFRFSTALKQLASSPVFAVYATDPKCLSIWAKNSAKTFAHQRQTLEWAKANSPMFKKRWESKFAGMDIFESKVREGNEGVYNAVKSSKVGKGVRTIDDAITKFATEYGMTPNAFIDAMTVANGIRTVYEYEVYLAEKRNGGKPATEEQKRKALVKAEIAFNESQQSSESAFVSQWQSNRTFVTRALATYQNSAYGFHRLRIAAANEYWKQAFNEDYRNRLVDTYGPEQAKKMLEDARNKALAQLLQGTVGDVIFVLMGAAGTVPLFTYLGGDDDEGEAWDLLKTAMVNMALNVTTGGYALGSLLGSGLFGYNMSLDTAWENLVTQWNVLWDYDVLSWPFAYQALNIVAVNRYGVDFDTLANIVIGIEGIIDGESSVEGVMKVLNIPQSQINLVAGKRREGESIQEYVARRLRIESIGAIPYIDESGKVRANPGYWQNPLTPRKSYVAKYRGEFEDSNRRATLTKIGGNDEYRDFVKTEEEYKDVVKALGWAVDTKPNNNAYIDGVYSVPPIDGLSKEDYNALWKLAYEAAHAAKDEEKFVGTEDRYYDKLKMMTEKRQKLIDRYNEL